MIKKTIKYNDFLGNERVEDHYFNLSQAELVEWNLIENDTLFDTLTEIGNSSDGAKIVPMFKKILGKGYGKLDADGRRFSKPDGAWEEFLETGAWEVLIMELLSNEDYAAQFINGLIPAAMLARAKAQADEQRAENATSAQTDELAERLSRLGSPAPVRPTPQDRLPKHTASPVEVVRTPIELIESKATPQPVQVVPEPQTAPSVDPAAAWGLLSAEEQRAFLAQTGTVPTNVSRPPHESGLNSEG